MAKLTVKPTNEVHIAAIGPFGLKVWDRENSKKSLKETLLAYIKRVNNPNPLKGVYYKRKRIKSRVD